MVADMYSWKSSIHPQPTMDKYNNLYYIIAVPAEAGINLLLCLSVYLMLVNSKMPLSSKSFPLLTKFYGCTIMILVVSLCCSCWVYSYYFMNPSGWDVYHMPSLLEVRGFHHFLEQGEGCNFFREGRG